MSGTVKGKIDSYHDASSLALNVQEMFVNLYTFVQALVSAGYASMVATNYGSGGTGFNYHDVASPTGNNAWFVFRMLEAGSSRSHSYDVLVQYSTSNNFGSSPGNPGTIIAAAGGSGGNIGIAVAWAFEADGTTWASPWAGTTNVDGADTKGATVWTPPGGGTVHVLPRSNNTGGSHATNRENCAALIVNSSSTSLWRFNVVADRDSIYIWLSKDDADVVTHSCFIGSFAPAGGSSHAHPMVMACNNGATLYTPNTTIGSTAGSAALEGGAALPAVASGIRTCVFNAPGAFNTLAYHPNMIYERFDMAKLSIISNEASYTGFLGEVSFLRWGYNVSPHVRNSDKTLIALGGDAANANYRLWAPWDGSSAPRDLATGFTRGGISF